jgi:hypothetical protein
MRGAISRLAAISLIALSSTDAVCAGERELIKTDWNGFRQQVSARKLNDRKVRIQLAGGGEIKTRLIETTGDGVVLRANRATTRWATGKKTAFISGDQIRIVRFEGHIGHHGLYTGLAGFAAGIGIAWAAAASNDVFEISGGVLPVVIPIVVVAGSVGLGVAGYFIGRATSRRAPEFLIEK